MPLLLTCDCGARFETDDHQGGSEVSCPECFQPVKVAQKPAARLDWLALFSVALALVGGLTVVGGVAAAALGLVSLVRIRSRPGALVGTGFAFAGVLLGLGLGAVAIALLLLGDRVPVGGWLRARQLAGRLDTSGTQTLGSRDGACFLPRLPDSWGAIPRGTSGDPGVDDLQSRRDLVLANPRLHAYADLHTDPGRDDAALIAYFDLLADEMAATRKPLLGGDDGENPLRGEVRRIDLVRDKPVPTLEGHGGFEYVCDLTRGGTVWRFLVRVYRKPRRKDQKASPVYVFRAYAPRERFVAHEAEIRALADGLRFSP